MAVTTIASVEIDLLEGEDKEVNIGFGAMFRVGGRAIYRGRPLADGRVFLVTPGVYGRSRRRASTDLEGNFLFENVEARDYEVLAFRAEPDISALLQTADRVPIVVVDEDVVRDFEFAGSGSMTGRIVNLPSGDWSWRLTLYAEDTSALPPEFLEAARGREHADGTTPIREAMLPTDGSFRFSALRPGRHTLEIHAGMVGVEEETRRTIMSDVFMPPDRRDLDLGEIELAE